MGLTFRKSIKIGKNTRLNLSSKGGVGVSTGVKGARVSINKQGTKAYGGVGPVRFQKQLTSKDKLPGVKHKEIETDINEENHFSNQNKPKTSFIKKYSKVMIAILIGFMIGCFAGESGKVSNTDTDKIKKEIENKNTEITNSESKLKELEQKKSALQLEIE